MDGRSCIAIVLLTALVLCCDSQSLNRPIRLKTLNTTPGKTTPKSKVSLTCGSEDIRVDLQFGIPFRGVVQAGNNKDPSCMLRGDGRSQYVLRVPLEGCNTTHSESTGSFTNTLSIRYHPSLEMEGDEIKTIICKFATGSLNIG